MTNGTVFRTLDIDRAKVQWESYFDELTPVHQGEVISYKREDWFAPLGYGGINGSKLRQCIYLLHRASRAGHPGVISAGSVKSPQHAMVATVAKHYGLRSHHVVGATKPTTALKHDSVAIAMAMGAEFEYIPVGYNAALQARVRELSDRDSLFPTRYQDYYRLEYAISLNQSLVRADQIAEFHGIGAFQVQNIPPELNTLLMPAGSLNSAASVLMGLARHQPMTGLMRVHLIGIGHNRMDWLVQRMQRLGVRLVPDSPKSLVWRMDGGRRVQYHDLVGSGYTDYQQMWREEMDGIIGHPTYEAKCFRYLKEQQPELLHDRALFWIVGSEPKLASMTHV